MRVGSANLSKKSSVVFTVKVTHYHCAEKEGRRRNGRKEAEVAVFSVFGDIDIRSSHRRIPINAIERRRRKRVLVL